MLSQNKAMQKKKKKKSYIISHIFCSRKREQGRRAEIRNVETAVDSTTQDSVNPGAQSRASEHCGAPAKAAN